MALARVLLPQLNRFKLDTVAKALGVSLENHHRAVDDAGCTAEIFVKVYRRCWKSRISRHWTNSTHWGALSESQIKKLPTYHAIILAKNDIGRVNLYRLVSWSHLTVFTTDRPRDAEE